jgi:hypothetical protein
VITASVAESASGERMIGQIGALEAPCAMSTAELPRLP